MHFNLKTLHFTLADLSNREVALLLEFSGMHNLCDENLLKEAACRLLGTTIEERYAKLMTDGLTKIAAIKMYREERKDASLDEAKTFIEKVMAEAGLLRASGRPVDGK